MCVHERGGVDKQLEWTKANWGVGEKSQVGGVGEREVWGVRKRQVGSMSEKQTWSLQEQRGKCGA